MDLRPFQRVATDHCVSFLRAAKRGQRQLYGGPTGCGKSFVELAVQRELPNCWIVSPREEILDGMMNKMGWTGDPYDRKLCTPIRLRNKLVKGEGDPPSYVLWDESHHQIADSYQQLELLSGLAPAAGFTATPYRGSPRSTRDFLELWGEPLWMITLSEAEAMGYVSLPTYEMLPLVDDDEIEVTNGEFTIESVESATMDRLEHLATVARERWMLADGTWNRPTIFAFPSSRLCNRLAELLPVTPVSAATPRAMRSQAFKDVVDRKVAIAHINIVTEGVDAPLRRLVDCSPVMSPVKFVQQMGRVMRPVPDGEPKPIYTGCNRNILRHSYALEGCVPNSVVAEAEKVFGFSERTLSTRVIGMESIGRFRPARVRTASGITVHVYCVSEVSGSKVTDYAALAHPGLPPIWAVRVHVKKEDGSRDWGKWQRCEAPASLRGFGSASANPVSEKQRVWWKRSAAGRGLDPSFEPDKRSFAALPFLMDLNMRLS